MKPNQELEQVIKLAENSRLNDARQLCDDLCHNSLSESEQAWCLLSAICLKLGAHADAVQYSKKSLTLNPDNTEPYIYLGIARMQQGEHEDAIQYFEKALTLNHGLVQAYVCLNNIYNHTGQTSASVNVLIRAHKALPDNLDIACLLAEAYEKSNAVDNSRELLEHILAHQPEHPVANIVLARIEHRAGHYVQAADLLLQLLDNDSLGKINRMNAEYLLGKIYDRAGEYKKAYRATRMANDTAYRLYGDKYKGSIFLDKIYRYKGAINSETVKAWAHPNAKAVNNDPVFLIGFPRSGTTLTEQILACHPDIVTSDERQLIQDTRDRLMSVHKGLAEFPYILHKLSHEEINDLRNYYLSLVNSSTDTHSDAGIFIDKMPLNIIEIGLIKRIFPNPKFILLIRDPRDVCLSCFMQSFIPNNAMINFTSIENTARLYSATMDLWLHYNDSFKLDVYKLKYEHLVRNTRTELAGLIDFLGLEWTDKLLDHKERKNRTVSTPSYQDIEAPIYNRAISRWHNYAEELTCIEESLAPYINYFNY